MAATKNESAQLADWNVLIDPWLEVMGFNAEAQVYSPLDALKRAREIRCIVLASPLDLFAAHRFLLTLLYWKADVSGGVQQVRESLLKGETPRVVLDAIEAEAPCFRMFDDKAPFLQDRSLQEAKKKDSKSAGSLYAEFTCGTNIAHFHHGDDEEMRLCVRCATIGLMRVIPWSQSGGAGLSPSVHNAPPIMVLASGRNLAVTLGLNLVPLPVAAGEAKWTGHFVPTDKDAAVPYLEAFTWNPRRIHLRSPEGPQVCWRCGLTRIIAVGPIVYLKNEKTTTEKDENKKSIPFKWQEPSAFYAADEPYKTIKSLGENRAASGDDLRRLKDQVDAPKALVVEINPNHEGWYLVIPCTDSKMKTFDHRQFELTSFSPDAVRAELPSVVPRSSPSGIDGWTELRRATCNVGSTRFVRAADRLLAHSDWAALSAAAYREMHDSPAAFDVLTGLLWGLRDKKISGLPPRHVAWLLLKLMATVTAHARIHHDEAVFCPLRSLPKRQLAERRND
ncbi:MAG: type I-E CRISPR-associated protein Cse1/CasA, partial [Planctomycetota bacterium]